MYLKYVINNTTNDCDFCNNSLSSDIYHTGLLIILQQNCFHKMLRFQIYFKAANLYYNILHVRNQNIHLALWFIIFNVLGDEGQ